MYCEYVIRNNAKSRIQNKWKGPLQKFHPGKLLTPYMSQRHWMIMHFYISISCRLKGEY